MSSLTEQELRSQLNNNVESSIQIQTATSYEDWLAVRDCYVQSFRGYPLYKCLLTDGPNRDKFLLAYLDANYAVTVGAGKGILLKMVVHSGNKEMRIAGGILCVPPAEDGCGWAINSDQPYWEAYEKYGLAKISAESLNRVKRYEKWENAKVTQNLARSRIPLWNGLFCAMLIQYAGKGIGSLLYQNAVRLISDYHGRTSDTLQREQPSCNSPTPPMIIAICHSDSSAHFYKINGFRLLTRLPYRNEESDENVIFYVHILALDPLKTGKANELKRALKSDQ